MKNFVYLMCGALAGVLIGWLIWGDVRGTIYPARCPDGAGPDINGCCGDEIYTDMGNMGFNCCPTDESLDCFPPLK